MKRHKNDAIDAEAICEAVTRPNMRFVATKTPEQQGCLTLHRTRHLFIRQQTSVINAIRAHLAEFGIVAPAGRHGVEQLLGIAADSNDKRLPKVARVYVAALGAQLLMLKAQILQFEIVRSGLAPIQRSQPAARLPHLSLAYAELGKLDDAWRCIGEAITAAESTKERWFEVEIHRIAGELALMSPSRDTVKAGAYFQRALTIARKQKAKSWELRAAMSMARLWRDQGKRQQADDLLSPVYDWFTEGFDTLDLKEAKALLDELHA